MSLVLLVRRVSFSQGNNEGGVLNSFDSTVIVVGNSAAFQQSEEHTGRQAVDDPQKSFLRYSFVPTATAKPSLHVSPVRWFYLGACIWATAPVFSARCYVISRSLVRDALAVFFLESLFSYYGLGQIVHILTSSMYW